MDGGKSDAVEVEEADAPCKVDEQMSHVEN